MFLQLLALILSQSSEFFEENNDFWYILTTPFYHTVIDRKIKKNERLYLSACNLVIIMTEGVGTREDGSKTGAHCLD